MDFTAQVDNDWTLAGPFVLRRSIFQRSRSGIQYMFTAKSAWMRGFNPFPNKPWFLHVWITSLLKTLWEKEKLLVTSNFSFYRSVFYPFGELTAVFIKFTIVVCNLYQFGRILQLSFGKGLTLHDVPLQGQKGTKRFDLSPIYLPFQLEGKTDEGCVCHSL